MNLNFTNNFIILLFLLINVGCSQNNSKSSAKKPNVIIILTDDQGYGDLAINGNPWIKTPAMDRLLQSGINFQNFHVDPTCSPTRAALMTGRYSARVGVWMTYMGRHHLNSAEITMADVFRQNGYKTGIIGKWHLGDNYPFRPSDRGFDESLIHGSGVIGETPDIWENDYYDDTYFRNNQPEKFKGYCTDIWFDEAKKFITKSKDKPFFLYLPLNSPHGPLNVPIKYVRPYLNNPEIPEDRAWFYGMIANIDENLESFQNFLINQGLEENTILIFMTDNGTASGFIENSNSGFNAGMRGRKGSPYEGGHRVPFVMKWPRGGWNAYKEINNLTAHIDILPTLIDVLDLNTEKAIQFDGRSLLPLIKNPKNPDWQDRSIGVHNQISFGEKLEHDRPVKYKKYAVMTEQWRLVNGNELYEIKKDIGQNQNVIYQYPEIAAKMNKSYEDWWASISEKFDEYNSTIIGSPKQEKVTLNCQFWHGDDVPYNQEHIRNGMMANGFWDIDVVKAGKYKFVLRRWPRELDIPMQEIVPNIDRDTSRIYNGFKLYNLKSNPLKITKAGLKVGDFERSIAIAEGQKEVAFEVSLKEGKQFVETQFILENGDSLGAYYVYIEPLE
ncbi:arylsulfatase [Flexithrix dorotheae]|uniref:arylsulfatase n=1 Tax=Flexithrix dorotheae TaxID=70993 RepID=UPI000362BD45|nr:arylsulfatase [Flexithrix dorotheae]